LAIKTDDNARMPFWLPVVAIHTVDPGLAFLAVSSVPCDKCVFQKR
jgi:hypothetical protein